MKNIMSEHSPSGWYKCKLRKMWTAQYVVCYYTAKEKLFYFGTQVVYQDEVKEVKEYVMDVMGSPMNNIVHT